MIDQHCLRREWPLPGRRDICTIAALASRRAEGKAGRIAVDLSAPVWLKAKRVARLRR
jgi:hypothetical protein